MFDMNIVGLEAVTDFIDACAKNEAKLLRKATAAGGRVILKAAKARCNTGVEGHHVRINDQVVYLKPGNLKRSLKMKILKQKTPGIQLVLVGPEVGKTAKHDGWYGRLVENGTSKTQPNAFLRPAYDENQEQAFQKMAEVYNENWGDTVIKDIEDLADVLVDL